MFRTYAYGCCKQYLFFRPHARAREGETWTMTGSGLATEAEEGVRWIPDVALQCPGAEGFEGHFLRLTPSADGKTMTLSPNPNQPTPPSGTYENARLSMMTIKDDVQEVLDIPIKLVVSA